MPDEPVTTGELARRIENVHQDLKEDIRDLGIRMDSKVAAEVFQLQVGALTEQVKQIEARREADLAKSENRRWLVYLALLGAGLAFLGQLYNASRGTS